MTGSRKPMLLSAGAALFAGHHLILAGLMAGAPRLFYEQIGGFGVRNDHYIRDTSTFEAALALGLAVAVRRASWRVPMLAVVALQFTLHALNHLVDIGRARPAWVGPVDLVTLALSAAALGWLLVLARRAEEQPFDASTRHRAGGQP